MLCLVFHAGAGSDEEAVLPGKEVAEGVTEGNQLCRRKRKGKGKRKGQADRKEKERKKEKKLLKKVFSSCFLHSSVL